MNEQEYIEKVCAKCKNRLNDRDLCKIVRGMDGKYSCTNEELEE